MKKVYLFVILFLSLCYVSVFAVQKYSIDTYFNQLSHAEKYLFLKNMPKSGELHTHLGGSVYPETLISLGNQYCIQAHSYVVNRDSQCDYLKLKDLPKDHALYEKTLRAWSMKDFDFKKGSGHDHFFNTFGKFYTFVQFNQPALIADTLRRAMAQHENYLELMITPDLNQASKYASLVDPKKPLAENYHSLINNKAFMAHIHYSVHRLYKIDHEAKKILGCDKTPCPTTIKYQYYIMRDQSMPAMIAQSVAAFESTSRSTKLVGINLVQAEDAYRPLKYYKQQMAVLDFLHQQYPNVNISLHAGELNNKTIASNDLTFHIRDAIIKGHAERIGHGVDIAFENDALDTLAYMKKHDIPVEVNLTSNEQILNATPKTHPLTLYLHHGVPVVLSTDDEGILRTTLTDEYLKAIESYHVDYATLKQINRNGLSYGFLNGHSIWANNNRAKPVKACEAALHHMTLDKACATYLGHNIKARHQWQLEKALYEFERNQLNS